LKPPFLPGNLIEIPRLDRGASVLVLTRVQG
jgi:hypothetical protein